MNSNVVPLSDWILFLTAIFAEVVSTVPPHYRILEITQIFEGRLQVEEHKLYSLSQKYKCIVQWNLNDTVNKGYENLTSNKSVLHCLFTLSQHSEFIQYANFNKFEANSYRHLQVYSYLWPPEEMMVDQTACLATYYSCYRVNP